MNRSVSHFVKTVCMKDWWLTKADNNTSDNTLAVAGVESSGQPAARVFFSAPIVERLDHFTLKTADGIFVLLKGPINKKQTKDNGFSEEVFKYFLVGFPSNWEKCAEIFFRQRSGSEANVDTDLHSEPSTVTNMEKSALKQNLWNNPDFDNRPEHLTDEAQEAITELQNDQNIDFVEGRVFEEPRPDVQNHIEEKHETFCCQNEDTCVNNDSPDANGDTCVNNDSPDANGDTCVNNDSPDANGDTCVNNDSPDANGDTRVNNDSPDVNIGYMGERVRYCLRNRVVPYFGSKGVYRSKDVKNVAEGKSSSMEPMIGIDTSPIPSVASLEKSPTPSTVPLCDKSSKEKADHPHFEASGGVNDTNRAKNIAPSRCMSISGEASFVDNDMHSLKEAQIIHRHDDMNPIPQDASMAKNLISNNSGGGKSHLSQKRKRRGSESRTALKTNVTARSSLKRTGENLHASSMSLAVGVAHGGNNIVSQSVMGDGENKQMPCRQRSASPKIKKRSTRGDSRSLETNAFFSPRDADKSKNSTYNIGIEKSHGTKDRKLRNSSTRTTADNNCHDLASPTSRTCSSKARSNSKAAAVERESKASQESLPKLGARKKLDYPQETTPTPKKGRNKSPTSQGSVLRTSRSGRLLLPTMEFWRNQLPVYDADHGISGILEGSTILKVKTPRGRSGDGQSIISKSEEVTKSSDGERDIAVLGPSIPPYIVYSF